MLWVPQIAGAPDIAGNQPHDYWPGRQWVGWVGTDFYGKFPNFSGLTALYNAYPGQPFTFGEYALWGSDDPGIVDRLFGWIGSHPRARMLIYNQGLDANGPFRPSSFHTRPASWDGCRRGPSSRRLHRTLPRSLRSL